MAGQPRRKSNRRHMPSALEIKSETQRLIRGLCWCIFTLVFMSFV